MICTVEEAREKISELESDVMVLAGRLLAEDDSTLAPETARVMAKYRPKWAAFLRSGEEGEE